MESIEKILKNNEELIQDNLNLRDLYRRTALHLKEKGKDDLADYFLAQINEIPTMGTMDLYKDWISRSKVEELGRKIHVVLDSNGITRGYQLLIDGYFMELLEGK